MSRLNLVKNINSANEIAIISHVRPDGDTIGAALSMYYFIKTLGKTAYLLCSDNPPEFLNFMKGIENFSTNCPLSKVDLAIAVDTATLDRLGKFEKLFCDSSVKINIDHHKGNIGYGDLAYVEPNATSTCQIMFDIYNTVRELDKASEYKDIMASLYVGMSTDTGHFMHSKMTSKVFMQVATIANACVDIDSIAVHLYKSNSKKRTMLVARAINNMRWFYHDSVCIIPIMLSDLDEFGCTLEDTEGIVNYAINIKGVQVGILITEYNTNQYNQVGYKISLRAKSIDVAACASVFGGGGHTLAAGCMLYGEIEEVINKLLDVVKPQLQ